MHFFAPNVCNVCVEEKVDFSTPSPLFTCRPLVCEWYLLLFSFQRRKGDFFYSLFRIQREKRRFLWLSPFPFLRKEISTETAENIFIHISIISPKGLHFKNLDRIKVFLSCSSSCPCSKKSVPSFRKLGFVAPKYVHLYFSHPHLTSVPLI